MKRTRRDRVKFISGFCAMLMCAAIGTSFVACDNGSSSDDTKSSTEKEKDPEPEPNPNPDGTIVYPTFSPIGGFYKEKQTVTISAEDGAEIYYTILKQTYDSNGKWDESAWKEAVKNSKPTTESNKYTGSFEIEEDCIIRAMSVNKAGDAHYALTCFDFDLDRSTDTDSQSPVDPKSESWQDQSIYFILTDRFWNGDSSNDRTPDLTDQNGNPYDESKVLPGQPASGYQGGDIQGVIDKLDYIQNMGFTAIWLTPPVKCQVAESNYHGFHGYWASDMTEVDPHMGSLKVYQDFVREAHNRGMYVVQDIVVNHFGDYQKICTGKSTDGDGEIKPKDFDTMEGNFPENYFFLEPASVPFNHPEQLPWALNDINDLTKDEFENCAFYHYNGGISDYTNAQNMYTHSSSDLDDLVTESPLVRNLLRGYFRYWIDKVGLDAYRIDTAKYVEPEFFEDFINCEDPENMGVSVYATSVKGKKEFINFGEAWDQSETLVGSYTYDKATKKPRMEGMIYFPLRFALTDAISSGGKTSGLTEVLNNRFTKGYYRNPEKMVTFVDNHDTDRWGQTMKGNIELQKAAYNVIYTIPGIPQVYYGSEQGFEGQCRQGMFKGSFLDDGTVNTEDHFDTDGDWYKYFTNLNKMRSENKVFRQNKLTVIQDTKDSAGVFAYIVRETSDRTCQKTPSTFKAGQKAIFVMNTANSDKILDATYVGIAPGEKYSLVPYEGISVCPEGKEITEEVIATKELNNGITNGNIKLIVPGNSTAVYILSDVSATSSGTSAILTVDELPEDKVSSNSITMKGTSDTTGTAKIVLNGDYSIAQSIEVTADVQFTKEIDISSYSNGIISVQLVMEIDDVTSYSSQKSFEILRPFTLIAKYTDPENDDNGVGLAKGKLKLPKDEGWKGQFDILGVDVYRSGNDVRLGLRMKMISRGWDPNSNLFDRVVLYTFVSDGDDSTGCKYHSRNNYTLPSEFGKWDYMFQCNGWGQSYYSSKNAGENTLGSAITPSASNTPKVNWEALDAEEQKKTGNPKATVIEKEIDWSTYNPEIGSTWEEKPGMIWITISAAAMGFPKDITGYKFFVDNYDFDMGSPRGMVEGEPEQWKFGTGDLKLEETPKVVDETDEVIVIK